MATTNFMVAIELGSTRIMGVAGQKDLDGSLTILAYASEDASTCIRKGVVFNIDKTAQSRTAHKGYQSHGGQKRHSHKQKKYTDLRRYKNAIGENYKQNRTQNKVGGNEKRQKSAGHTHNERNIGPSPLTGCPERLWANTDQCENWQGKGGSQQRLGQ